MTEPRVPAYIVTGFLGAGKTTLLTRLIEEADGKRFAIIVNEFGEMGFDGELVAARCPDVVELKNGCVCCRVGDDLVPTLEAFLDREPKPDAILIETSGLALPQPVVEAFAFPTLRSRARVAGVVVLADGVAIASGGFDATLEALTKPPSLAPRRPSALHGGADGDDDPLGEVFEDQIRAADLVVLTKLDLLDDEACYQAMIKTRDAMPAGARFAIAKEGRVEAKTLLDLARAPDADARPSRHGLEAGEHDHDDFASMVVDIGEVDDRQALARRVMAATRELGLLRVKGFVAERGRPERFTLQATPGSTTIAADGAWVADGPRATRLVVIGLKDMPADAIAAAIRGTS